MESTPTTEAPTVSSQPVEGPGASPIESAAPQKTTKNHKILLWFLGILAVIGIAAAITFAILYFSNQKSPDQSTQPSSTPETMVESSDEETTLTDSLLKKDLDEKIAMIFFSDETTPTFYLSGVNSAQELLKNGDLNIGAKITSALKHATSYKLSTEEAKAASAQSNFNESNTDYFIKEGRGVKSADAAQKYKEVFGEDLTKGAEGTGFCLDYKYNQQYDFYYNQVLGCGGTSPLREQYYKNKYTTDAEHAYVYISAALLNYEDSKVYCDVSSLDDYKISEDAAVCGELSEGQEFTLDASNYQNFAEYRAVFNKDADGNYYFSKIEKLSN